LKRVGKKRFTGGKGSRWVSENERRWKKLGAGRRMTGMGLGFWRGKLGFKGK